MTTVPASPDSDSEPSSDLHTIADLPFHIMGRLSTPLLIGQSIGGKIAGLSNVETFERIRDLSLGLRATGISQGDRVAIVSESRPEWVISDLAILAAGAVTVPIYPTLSAGQARYILQDCGARLAIVSTAEQLEKLQEIRHLVPTLEAIVVMAPADNLAASVMTLDELERRGHARLTGEWGAAKEFRDIARAVRPEQLATIIYTSGTTGEPKGVMLSHGNLASNRRSGAEVLNLTPEDVALSFLPLSHGFERMVAYIYLADGVSTIFAESLDTVARDIALVRPTVFTGVPRVYEKLQARILETGQSASPARARIFRWSVRSGLARSAAILRGKAVGPITAAKSALADRLVFAKIRARLGGRLRFVVSGSAPLPETVMEFFHAAGLTIVEGYGLTETSPILTVNPPAAPRVGSVGRPVSGVDLRIAPDGEILARGPNIMSGYFNKPEATAEVLRDGWFHTGDIGAIDADGYLRITDRKKDLIVTSGGKNVAPQPIEATLKRSPLVAEAVILGDRRKYIAALIVADFAALERRLKDLGRPPGERAALLARPDVLALYSEIVDALNRDLSQFERIKKFALLPREFTIASGELTPTMKVKRKVVEQQWQAEIAKLYDDQEP